MIDRLITFSIRWRWLVILLTACFALWGIRAAVRTPIDAIPDLSENQVIVFTEWTGHGPREIEDQVTYPLALELQGLAGVRVVRSSSDVGFSMISVIFEDRVAAEVCRRQVERRLAALGWRNGLPERLPAWPPTPPRPARSSGTPSKAMGSTSAGCARSRTGTSAPSSRPCRAWPRSPASAGGPSSTRSNSTRSACRPHGITPGQVAEAIAASNAAVGGTSSTRGTPSSSSRGVGWLGARPGNTRRRGSIRSASSATWKTCLSSASDGTPVPLADVASVVARRRAAPRRAGEGRRRRRPAASC